MAGEHVHAVKLYFRILGLSLRSRMSFRLDFIVMLISVFLREVASLSLLVVVVYRFDNLAGWNMWEMAFLYCMVTFTQRNFSSFAGGIMSIGDLIKSGEMDVYVMTPRDPLFLINSRNTMVWRVYYNIGIFALLIFFGFKAGIAFTVPNILLFLIMMASAAIVMAAVFLAISSLAFFTIDISNLIWAMDEVVRKYMIYPISIFGTVVSAVLTFLIPLGFIAYYPASFLLGKAQTILFSPALAALTPVFALGFFALAYRMWRWGLKHYNSTGT